MKHLRMLIGVAFWCGLLGLLWGVVAGQGGTAAFAGRQCLSSLWGYYTSTQRLELRLAKSCDLSIGDPLLAADSHGWLQQVGIIVDVCDGTRTAQAVLLPTAPELCLPVQAYHFTSPDSLEWIVQTLLPEERRKRIEEELTAALQEHHQELLNAIQPVVNKGIGEARAVLEEDLPLVLEKHRPELRAIAGKNEEVLKRELVALVKAEVWPIVHKASEPLVSELSRELWERVSLSRFVWRGMLDKTPGFRGKHRVEEELRRFLDQEAVPIFERHEQDFLAVMDITLRGIAENDQVKAALKRRVLEVAGDPELQRVLGDILHQAVVQNPRFWSAVRQSLSSPEAQDALELTGNRLEPTVRRIGDLVLGTREDGLTPEFNRVLRQQILLKDRHGVILGTPPLTGPNLQCTALEVRISGTKP
jgi:hypothetical protein